MTGSSARAAKRPLLGRDAADDSTTLEGAGLDNRTSSFVRPAAGDAVALPHAAPLYTDHLYLQKSGGPDTDRIARG